MRAKPTLVVRAIPKRVDDFFAGYAAFDPENRRRAEIVFEDWQRVVIPAGDRFVREVKGANELRIEGGMHMVFLTYAGRLRPPIREFLLSE